MSSSSEMSAATPRNLNDEPQYDQRNGGPDRRTAFPWAGGRYGAAVTAVDPEPTPDEADRLVRAAWDVLARTGFEGFKVASVIRAAGSSTKGFYRHFASKDEMLLALLIDETNRA